MKTFNSFFRICTIILLYTPLSSLAVQIMGGVSYECYPNSDTIIGIPLNRIPVDGGVIDSVNLGNKSIIPLGTTSWKDGGFVYDAVFNPEHYYVRFTSGALEGAWFDICANTSFSISLNIGQNDLSLLSKGDRFEIIPHWTLNKLFPNGGNLKKNNIPAKGTKCSIIAKYTYYDEYGNLKIPEGVNNTYQKFFYYRDFNGDVGWRERRSSDIDWGDQIIEPNAFIVLRQPEESESFILKIAGQVSRCSSSVEVISLSESNQENYMALPSCADTKLTELTEAFVGSGLMESSIGAVRPADALLVYDNSNYTPNRAPSGTYFHYSGNLSEEGWYRVGTGSPSLRKADNAVIRTGSALVILKKSGSKDNFLRAKYKPSYLEE